MTASENPPLTRQTWRNLIALHWPVTDDALRPLVPPELELLLVDGKWWVTLAAFEVAKIELASTVALPSIAAFAQIELRTAVRDRAGHPGTWFLAVDATSAAVAAAARAAFGLPYGSARVALEVAGTEEPSIRLAAKRDTPDPVSCTAALRATGLPAEPPPSSLEETLVFPRRAWTGAAGSLAAVDLTRGPAKVARARIESLDETWLWAAGIRRPAEPPIAHFVRETSVALHR